jgi:trehalose 6-phosphate phosphatase
MQPLFSRPGWRRLDQVLQPGVLCVFDFDGTLAPIVPQPEEARLPEEVLRRLLSLSQLAPVGVLTGRSLEDIRTRLGFEPQYLVGNHGLQGLPGWEAASEAYLATVRGWARQLEPRLPKDEGVFVEDKQYSLSLHFRNARDPKAIENSLREAAMELEPLPRVMDGKFLVNLLPEAACDKGDAMLRLMEISGCSTAIYVGDDVTDEDAFRVNHPGLLTVRIEPHEQSAAQFFLPQHRDIVHLLDHMLERLCADTVGGGDMMQRSGS